MAAASSFRHHLSPLLFVLFLAAAVTTGVEEDELESMLAILRVRGYALFSNAIATSDIIYEIFNSNSSFTFFAPTDSNLYAIDMINTASDYTSVLRCHVVPLRLTLNELRRLPFGYGLDTLVKYHVIKVSHRSGSLISDNDAINLDGVEVVLPGLFYSRDIAVHGLGGMLNCLKTGFGSGQDSPSAAPSEPPIYSPVINGIGAAPHGTNFAGFHEPPYNAIESPVPEPAVFGRYSPANSPEISLPPADSLINHRNFTPIVNNTAEPPLRMNFTEPPTSAWLENLTIKPLVPEPAVFGPYSPAKSPHFSPANFCDTVSIFAPVVDGSAPSPQPTNITRFLQPPASGSLDSNTVKSPAPEPVDFDGYLPAHSPNISHLPPVNFSGNRSIFPPAVTESIAPPLPLNFTPKLLDNNTIKSPVSEPAGLNGYPLIDAPTSADNSPQYLPDNSMSFPTPALESLSPEKENDELSMVGLDDQETERENQLLHSIPPECLTEMMEGMQYAS
ncbi:Hypothetical predicted protein [Olea europaea subsp. europaea]|uniref:FAS1 domain-containing protein n=1 Tax=Olea europaea subsp. europaea TaxID=158383 RepID=A0A8S0RSB7_OLEEU|nr:Hypothetical predicted protein [Olea europaea subsp. europaea]